MQQIILTQKDADWVANVIRDKLCLLEENYKAALNGCSKTYGYVSELVDNLFPGEVKYKKALEELADYSNSNKREETFIYNKRKSEYERIIELMMVGSYA